MGDRLWRLRFTRSPEREHFVAQSGPTLLLKLAVDPNQGGLTRWVTRLESQDFTEAPCWLDLLMRLAREDIGQPAARAQRSVEPGGRTGAAGLLPRQALTRALGRSGSRPKRLDEIAAE